MCVYIDHKENEAYLHHDIIVWQLKIFTSKSQYCNAFFKILISLNGDFTIVLLQ